LGRSTTTQSNYQFQNYTSIQRKTHSWRLGVRMRGTSETSVSPQNFGGAFTFSGGLAPQLDANNHVVSDNSGQPILVKISSIESYRRTLVFQQLGVPAMRIRQLGGGASQFRINTGNPIVSGICQAPPFSSAAPPLLQRWREGARRPQDAKSVKSVRLVTCRGVAVSHRVERGAGRAIRDRRRHRANE
jgi:hypothetical protein